MFNQCSTATSHLYEALMIFDHLNDSQFNALSNSISIEEVSSDYEDDLFQVKSNDIHVAYFSSNMS